jgi:hypothetical protein
MARTFQVNSATRTRDALFMTLLRAGVNMGTTSLLTVRVGIEHGYFETLQEIRRRHLS